MRAGCAAGAALQPCVCALTHVQEGHQLLNECVGRDKPRPLPQLGACDGINNVDSRQLLQVVLHHQLTTHLRGVVHLQGAGRGQQEAHAHRLMRERDARHNAAYPWA